MQQRSQDAAETRNREIQVDRAEHGNLDSPTVSQSSSCFRRQLIAEENCQRDEAQQQHDAPAFKRLAGPHQPFGDGRQLALLAEVFKDLTKVGHEEDQQSEDDQRSHDGQEHGIGQRRHRTALQVLLLFGELSDSLQGVLQKAALAAGANHADGQIAKRPRMRPHRLGQRDAVFHAPMDILKNRLEVLVGRSVCARLPRSQQWHAAAQQPGQLAVECGHLLTVHASPARPGDAFLFGLHRQRKQRFSRQLRNRFALTSRGQSLPLTRLPFRSRAV